MAFVYVIIGIMIAVLCGIIINIGLDISNDGRRDIWGAYSAWLLLMLVVSFAIVTMI